GGRETPIQTDRSHRSGPSGWPRRPTAIGSVVAGLLLAAGPAAAVDVTMPGQPGSSLPAGAPPPAAASAAPAPGAAVAPPVASAPAITPMTPAPVAPRTLRLGRVGPDVR